MAFIDELTTTATVRDWGMTQIYIYIYIYINIVRHGRKHDPNRVAGRSRCSWTVRNARVIIGLVAIKGSQKGSVSLMKHAFGFFSTVGVMHHVLGY